MGTKQDENALERLAVINAVRARVAAGVDLAFALATVHKSKVWWEKWTQRDGLNMGEVEYLPGEDPQPVPEQHRVLEQALRRVLTEVPELYAGITPRYEDASWVSFRLAEILPLPLPERLELLILNDPVERLTRIAAALPRR